MNAETRSWVELVALQLAGLVVATHVYWGLDRFTEQLRYSYYVDPRPLLFVLSSAAIIAGVAYVALGGRRKPVYLLGIALMLVYIFGYWGWHLMGHLPALPWVESTAHPHPEWGPVETLFRHLEQDDLALVSKLAEAALAIVLGVLWIGERRRSADAVEAPGDGGEPLSETSGSPTEAAEAPTEAAEAASDAAPPPADSEAGATLPSEAPAEDDRP